jgi:hypothetical protein
VLHWQPRVTNGVTKIDAKFIGGLKVADTDLEGALLHSRNKKPSTEKEKLAGNKRDKSGHIIRQINEN